jgi:hypothetical protein
MPMLLRSPCQPPPPRRNIRPISPTPQTEYCEYCRASKLCKKGNQGTSPLSTHVAWFLSLCVLAKMGTISKLWPKPTQIIRQPSALRVAKPLCFQQSFPSVHDACQHLRRIRVRSLRDDVDELTSGRSVKDELVDSTNTQVTDIVDIDRTAELFIALFSGLFGRKESSGGATEVSAAAKVTACCRLHAPPATGTGPAARQSRPDDPANGKAYSMAC